MDGEGLPNYLVAPQKEDVVLPNEFPCALQMAPDLVCLVFKAVESYHTYKLDPNPYRNAPWATRRAYISLLGSFSMVLADPILGVDHPVVSSNLKDLAKAVGRSWRSNLDANEDGVIVSALDVQAFLQLLATFGIVYEYKEGELLKMVTAIARRWQTPALCRSLGLTKKILDLVDKLVKEGKQIKDLSFANAFGIIDRIQLVSLLQEYVKEVKVATHLSQKNAHPAIAVYTNSITKELSVRRVFFEGCKLELQFPKDIWHKRVELLGKVKDRKCVPVAVHFLAKHNRLNKLIVGYVAKYNEMTHLNLERNLGEVVFHPMAC